MLLVLDIKNKQYLISMSPNDSWDTDKKFDKVNNKLNIDYKLNYPWI